MKRIAIIGGTALFGAEIFKEALAREIRTPCGSTFLLIKDDLVFLPRHGKDKNIPAHKVNHQANLSALKDLAVKQIVGINSTGSLKVEIPPGSILIPDDYINFGPIGTFYNHEIVHITPSLDEDLRKVIISAASKLKMKIIDKGVYIQRPGPRLETRAEIKMLSSFGDLVGMTMASEATAAKELGLSYASICSVDNYGHGLIDEPLKNEQIVETAKRNQERIISLTKEVIKELR
ncbi:MTAP family purine nucleoside phosphorylase [bacterium]|nr:MTAP family purine nucleoside phosphorylase [bacterium]